MKIDLKNKKILEKIQNNGKITNNELSESLGIPATTIFERIKKMEKEKIIKGYKAVVDPKLLGVGLTAFVFMRIKGVNFNNEVPQELKKIPYVLEIHEVAGDYSYLLKVCVKDHEHLSEVLKNDIGQIEGIATTHSYIVLKTKLTNRSYPVNKEG